MNRIGWSIACVIALVAIGLMVLLAMPSRTPEPIPAAARVAETSAPPAATALAGPIEPSTPELVVPVAGVGPSQLVDSWHDAREGGARVHEALDIAAPRGTPVVAAMAGRIEKQWNSERGGLTLYIRSVDGGSMAYYAHLADYAPGIAEGQNVTAGQRIGSVGDSGNAGVGNTHLHFALHRMAPGDNWYGGVPVNPYPLLARTVPSR